MVPVTIPGRVRSVNSSMEPDRKRRKRPSRCSLLSRHPFYFSQSLLPDQSAGMSRSGDFSFRIRQHRFDSLPEHFHSDGFPPPLSLPLSLGSAVIPVWLRHQYAAASASSSAIGIRFLRILRGNLVMMTRFPLSPYPSSEEGMEIRQSAGCAELQRKRKQLKREKKKKKIYAPSINIRARSPRMTRALDLLLTL